MAHDYPHPSLFDPDPDDFGNRTCLVCGGTLTPTEADGSGDYPEEAPIFLCGGCGREVGLSEAHRLDYASERRATIIYEQLRTLSKHRIPPLGMFVQIHPDRDEFLESKGIDPTEPLGWDEFWTDVAWYVGHYIAQARQHFAQDDEGEE